MLENLSHGQRVHIVLRAMIFVATVCFYAGLGSIALADEFRVLDNNNSMLSNTKVEISDGRRVQISAVTDNNGRLVVPFRGKVTVYQVTVARSGDRLVGSMLVDGQPGLKTVNLR